VENILEPLSHDLANEKYRGYRFKSENLPRFFKEFADHCYERRAEIYRPQPNLMGITYPGTTIVIPEELNLMNYFAQTFLLINKGKLSESYRELYKYKTPIFPYLLDLPNSPYRPYYFYSDEDRYLWFEFLQSELRSSGYVDFADSILETEIEHYRELIVWQLQLRAYLNQKLYEYGDIWNLHFLKSRLTEEYRTLKYNSLIRKSFEKAIGILRDIDDNVRATSPIDTSKGEIVLSWIDRDAIDKKQGIESELLYISPNPITWKTTLESIREGMKKEMKNWHEITIYYIRVLAVINEMLYLERDLKTMVQLHSKIVNNKYVSYTPAGIPRQDFCTIKSIYGDGRNFKNLDPLTSFNLRRHDLIASDFWGHYARRKNGDITVGDIILPWVEVPNK
jgi:hypothetical protein